jgi:hypothetical protein
MDSNSNISDNNHGVLVLTLSLTFRPTGEEIMVKWAKTRIEQDASGASSSTSCGLLDIVDPCLRDDQDCTLDRYDVSLLGIIGSH